MSLTSTIYNKVFKRTSSMVLVMVLGAYVAEAVLDYGAEEIFNRANKGKLWHHIEHNYKNKQ